LTLALRKEQVARACEREDAVKNVHISEEGGDRRWRRL